MAKCASANEGSVRGGVSCALVFAAISIAIDLGSARALGVTEGTVSGFWESGFMVDNIWGGITQVQTPCPGKYLGLSVGDTVTVFGGPSAEGIFLTSGIFRTLPDGDEEELTCTR